MTALARVGRTMRGDAPFQGVLVAGLVGLAVSRLTVGEAPAWSHAVSGATDLLMLSLVLVAFLRGNARLTTLERRFWQLLSAGVGSWLLATVLGSWPSTCGPRTRVRIRARRDTAGSTGWACPSRRSACLST